MTFGYVGAVVVVVSLLRAKLATLKINDHAVGGLSRVQTLFGGTIALGGVVKRIRNKPKAVHNYRLSTQPVFGSVDVDSTQLAS